MEKWFRKNMIGLIENWTELRRTLWLVLVVIPEDTVSSTKRLGMLMIEVAIRKQLRAQVSARRS
jgi:hypothetical protein